MSSVSTLTAVFSNIQLQLARYVYCPLYIAGNVGNILNLVVFSQAKLRTSSVCSLYFLCISVANLIAINTGFITRVLAYMGLPDPSRTIGWYCTGRVYISTLSLTLGRFFLCSIVIDRFLVTSTSAKLRRMSSAKVARWYIPLSVVSWMIFYVHVWVGYTGYQSGSSCKRQVGAYTLFITISSLVIEAVGPIILMLIFSLLTLNNLNGLRQRRSRVEPITHPTQMFTVTAPTLNNSVVGSKQRQSLVIQGQQERRKVGKQLTMISFIQVLVFMMFNTISAGYALYSVITSSDIRNADRAAIESFISAISVILTFIYGTVSITNGFYIIFIVFNDIFS
jgi:hypothetical protein